MEEQFTINDSIYDHLIKDDENEAADDDPDDLQLEEEIQLHNDEFKQILKTRSGDEVASFHRMPDDDIRDEELLRVQVSSDEEEVIEGGGDDEESDDNIDSPDGSPLTKGDIRDMLTMFFFARVHEDKKWRLVGRFPGKGKDSVLDGLLTDIGIERKRASIQWRKFKKNNGAPQPIRYEMSLKELEKDLKLRIERHGYNLVYDSAVAAIGQHGFNNRTISTEMIDTFGRLFETEASEIKSQVRQTLSKCTSKLAEMLSGASTNTIDKRASDFETFIRRDFKIAFNQRLRASLATKIRLVEDKAIVAFNLYFGRFYDFLLVQFDKAITKEDYPTMIVDLDSATIDQLLKGSKGVVYYVGGWVLFKLINNKGKSSDYDLRQTFVESLRLDSEANFEVTANLTNVTDKREYSEAKKSLLRSNYKWFSFISLLDTLYRVNLTAANARAHKGNTIQQISEAIRTSSSLRDRFLSCIPDQVTKQEKVALLSMYYREILPCYKNMKARDILRTLRKHERKNVRAAKRFTLRQLLVVQQLVAKKKDSKTIN